MKTFWTPPLYFHNVAEIDRIGKVNMPQDIVMARGKVLSYTTVSVALNCKMDFSSYPFDEQTCHFRISPSFDSDKVLRLTGARAEISDGNDVNSRL